MHEKTDIIKQTQKATLADVPAPDNTVNMTLVFDPQDPCAVTMEFSDGYSNPVAWTVGRRLFIDACGIRDADSSVGERDIQITLLPESNEGIADFQIDIGNSLGSARLLVDAMQVTDFVLKTLRAVKLEQESEIAQSQLDSFLKDVLKDS